MDEKITVKKQLKNTVKTIQTEASEQHGKEVSTDLKKQLLKIKWIAVGTCPQCGKELIRDAEADVAVCTCKSVIKVKLAIVAELPIKLERYFDKLAKQYGCTSDDAYNACFEVGFDNVPELLAKRSMVLKQLRERSEVK